MRRCIPAGYAGTALCGPPSVGAARSGPRNARYLPVKLRSNSIPSALPRFDTGHRSVPSPSGSLSRVVEEEEGGGKLGRRWFRGEVSARFCRVITSVVKDEALPSGGACLAHTSSSLPKFRPNSWNLVARATRFAPLSLRDPVVVKKQFQRHRRQSGKHRR